jgi:hypothetical protein
MKVTASLNFSIKDTSNHFTQSLVEQNRAVFSVKTTRSV